MNRTLRLAALIGVIALAGWLAGNPPAAAAPTCEETNNTSCSTLGQTMPCWSVFGGQMLTCWCFDSGWGGTIWSCPVPANP